MENIHVLTKVTVGLTLANKVVERTVLLRNIPTKGLVNIRKILGSWINY